MADSAWIWAAGVFGSVIGSTSTAYIVGDDEVRTKIIFSVPFILIATIGIVKLLSEQR